MTILNNVITDWVRSTRWEVIVSLCLSVHTCGGGVVPQPGPASQPAGGGGVPHLGYPPSNLTGVPPAGGVPHLGYPPVGTGWGVPPVGSTPPWVPPIRPSQGGTPPWVSPTWDLAGRYPLLGGTPPWVPPIWPGRGVPPAGGTPPWVPLVRPGWGVPPAGGVPHFGKQMEYLIRRGRYASCVHAGGLSCIWNSFIKTLLFVIQTIRGFWGCLKTSEECNGESGRHREWQILSVKALTYQVWIVANTQPPFWYTFTLFVFRSILPLKKYSKSTQSVKFS